MRKEICTSILVLMGMLLPIRAPSAETIRGAVTDSSGAVVQGAEVQLLSGNLVLAKTKTSLNGAFILQVPGEASYDADYSVMATASGFASKTQAGRLADLINSPLSLILEIAPYVQTVEVQATTPPNECVLDMSGVRESAAKDVGEALTDLEGIWKIRKGGIANDVVIRGFQQNNVNVLVDGSRTYGACPEHQDPPAEHVDFDEVDHVDVTRGALNVTNEGSLGAVVNIITKSPGLGFSVRPSFSAGSFDFFNPSITASYGNRVFRILGGYSYRSSDPYQDGLGHPFTYYANYSTTGMQQKAFDINSGWVEVEFSLSDRQQLSLAYTRQQAGLILYPYLTMDSNHDNADRGVVKYSAANLSSFIRNIRLEAYFTQVQHSMSDSERTTAMMSQPSMSANASTRTIGGRVEVDLGRNFTFGVESYNRNWNMMDYMHMSGMMTTTQGIPDVNTQTFGSFLTYHHSFSERWKLTAAARYDHAQMQVQATGASTALYYQFQGTERLANIDNYPSGNVQINATFFKSVEWFAGIGTTGRLPDAEERYISLPVGMGTTTNPNVGNPLLPITRDTELSTGVNWNNKHFLLRPTIFYSFLDNFIVVNDQPQMNVPGGMMGMGGSDMDMARSYTNVNARMYGGEMTLTIPLPQSFTLNGGLSYTRGTELLDPTVNIMCRNLPEIPPLRARASVRYARRWAFAEIGALGSDRQSHVDTDLNETPTAGYVILNFKLGATYKKLSASFTFENMLDRFYYEYLSYYRDPFEAGVKIPEPGRNYFLQLRYSF